MDIFNNWKEKLFDSGQASLTNEGVFWVQQKGHKQAITTAWGEKKSANFDTGEFPVITITSFDAQQNLSFSFENSAQYEVRNAKNHVQNNVEANGHSPLQSINYQFQTTKADFITKVNNVKKLAQNGELWVLNLAVDMVFPDLTDDQVFRAFNAWLQTDSGKSGSIVWTDELTYVSFSPETFMTQQGKKISTFPIKGTGSRDYLESSDKEQSELHMITDLLRNDLGQIAQKVTVPRPRFLTRHGDFYHAQAEIEADLGHDLTWTDYQTLLPAGSVSGAPKKRVVQFIQELEDFDRNFFTGTFCVRTSAQELQSSILIRTFFKQDDGWHFPVGVGITHLSDPEAEWAEIHQKLVGVLRFF